MDITRSKSKTFNVNLTIVELDGQLIPLFDDSLKNSFEVKQCSSCNSTDLVKQDKKLICQKCKFELSLPIFYEEQATFIKWGWALENVIRRDAIARDDRNGNVWVDIGKLRESKLKKMLVDWTINVFDEDGNNLSKIERVEKNENGVRQVEMTDECFHRITEIPEIADIITAFMNKADNILELRQRETKKN